MKKVLFVIMGFFVGFISVKSLTFASELLEEEKVMGRVFMEAEILEGDVLKVSVMGSDMVSPIVGAAFNLNYEKEKLEFLKYEPGEFFERGGDPVYLVKNLPEKSGIVFGETLRREDTFPTGSGGIANFYFQIVGEKKFILSFSNGVISTMNTVRQDLDRIIWEDLNYDENSKRLIDGDKLDAESQENFWRGWSDHKILFSLISAAFCLSVGMIFLLKKSREKSVNFK